MPLPGDTLMWTTPVVINNHMNSSPCMEWSLDNLPKSLLHTTMTFRIGIKSIQEVQWETDCTYAEATVEQFVHWTKGNRDDSGSLSILNPETHWCYADYKHMAKLFDANDDVLKSIDWSSFGFPGRGGAESTLWMGSDGASTVCHYDSYGCNLVAQVYGRKLWILFPPDDTLHMYPTRMPYEESSVFSHVNILNPDIESHRKFQSCHPHVVMLQAGDVLFVPRHWWHFVISVGESLSINTWLEMEADSASRLHESICRTIAMAAVPNLCNYDQQHWLNPTEEMSSSEINLTYVQQSLNMLEQSAQVHASSNEELHSVENKEQHDSEINHKRDRTEDCIDPKDDITSDNSNATSTGTNDCALDVAGATASHSTNNHTATPVALTQPRITTTVPGYTFDTYLDATGLLCPHLKSTLPNKKRRRTTGPPVIASQVMDALLHPSTIEHIANLLKGNNYVS